MTESEAIEKIRSCLGVNNIIMPYSDEMEAFGMAIEALEEIQQYRALGTVEELQELTTKGRAYNQVVWERDIAVSQLEEIGCSFGQKMDKVKEAIGKQSAKKPICKPMPYSEEVGFNDEWLCPSCKSYVGYFTEGMSEPEQMEYCTECGQHIARDWSVEE